MRGSEGMRNADLRALVDGFAGARIAVVGDLVADEYLYGETDRISREAPVLIVRYEDSEVHLGCGGNAAANVAALGARVFPVGLVGDDAVGERLRGMLRGMGADLAGVIVVPGRPTATKTRILAGGKNTRRQQMLRIDRDGPGVVPSALLGKLLRAVKDAAEQADAVLVSDYGLGTLSEPVIESVLALASRGKIVCADARYGIAQYRGVTLVKPNEVELEQAVGRHLGGDPSALEDAGRELLRTCRARVLLVTRGRAGMMLLRANGPTVVLPAHGTAAAVDVTGAGDTVIATATVALAASADPVQAARVANVAGALVILKPGTATVSPAELRRELSRGDVARAEALESRAEPSRRRRARR
ncbi:MAG: bifunctional heptose 7-phosphate kinase/heptose 1-phosphate adenyltransferase [Myxococcales bacterium]